MSKVLIKDYLAFCHKFYKGGFPHQRFGQAFVNTFDIKCEHNHTGPCLFYERNEQKAAKRILKYVGDD